MDSLNDILGGARHIKRKKYQVKKDYGQQMKEKMKTYTRFFSVLDNNSKKET